MSGTGEATRGTPTPEGTTGPTAQTAGEPSRDLTVALLWHSDRSANLGVGALTASHLAILEEISGRLGVTIRTVVLGPNEPSPFRIEAPGMRAAPLRDRHLIMPLGPLWSEIRGADLVLDVGAGDSFTDIYGWRRFLRIWGAKLAVLLQGRPLVLAPQTYGPFEGRMTRRLALVALSRAKLLASRDEVSIAFLRDIGCGRDVLLASDLAFRLPHTPPGPRSDGSPIRVGLNVSGLLFNAGYTRDNMFGLACDFADLMRQSIAMFERRGAEVHLIGHVNSEAYEVEDDWRVCKALAKEYPGTVLAPRFSHPSEAKSYIAGLDFFAGARMHACIAAFSTGVPVVPLAYSRKFEGLFGSLGYHRSVDCRSESAETVLAKLEAGFDAREELAEEIAVAIELGQKRLARYVDALERLLADAAGLPSARSVQPD